MSAKAFAVARGQTVHIVDIAGGQPGDFVALKSDDLSVRLSQARTRVENRSTRATRGTRLWTNTLPPQVMFTITGDTCGTHDLLYLPCCRYALETRFGVSRDGCLENLAKALEPWGVTVQDVPEPLNVFFHVAVDAAGAMEIRPPTSSPGDAIELRAEMGCVVAVSTCAVPLPGRDNSSYQIMILDTLG